MSKAEMEKCSSPKKDRDGKKEKKTREEKQKDIKSECTRKKED